MKKAAPLFVILAGCLWGSMGIFVRGLNACGLAAMDIVFLRVSGAALALGVCLLLFKRDKLRLRLRDLWCFLGSGIVSIVFFNFCYFSTIQMTSLSVAAIMLYTAPAIVTLFSIFLFRESFGPGKLLALFLAFAGCALVTGILEEETVLTAAGVLLGLGSGFGYAMYSIFGRYATAKGYSSATVSFYTFLFAAAGSLPFVRPVGIVNALQRAPQCLPLVFGLIFLNTLAAYLCYTAGLAHMEASKAAILASVEPVMAALIGFLLYKERIDRMTLAGILLVLLSVLLVNSPRRIPRERDAAAEKPQ